MIPDIQMPLDYDLAEFTSDKFIEIKSNNLVLIDLQYPKMDLKTAINRCFVRKEVYDKILKASLKLPSGYKFKILDAWRPLSLQKELYDFYAKTIIENQNLALLPKQEQEEIISHYVSLPKKSTKLPPVHTTGGAVDLTIVDNNSNELYMGCKFDSFSQKSHTSYFETNHSTENDKLARDNRRLLFNVMTDVGFTNLPSEWWHYDYGDRFWAFYTNSPAKFNGAFEMEDVYENFE